MFKNTHLFREAAINFKKNGDRYTLHIPGSKAYREFWKEERRRCKEGYEVDGVRITGYHYAYLNYSPILKTEVLKQSETEGKQSQAERVEGFPDFWDMDWEFFNYVEEAEADGQHAILGGSRGKGKSLKAASMCVRNYFHYKKSKSYCFASKEEYLIKDGIIAKAWELMDFIDSYTPWAKRRHEKNTEFHRRASTRIKNEFGVETTDPRSFKSEIIGVTTGDNINKLRGKRGKIIILEEGGSYPNLNKGWGILRPSMEDGDRTFGLILAIGTGGEEGVSWEGFEELFLNPEAYNIKPVQNTWDEGMENTKCGFFFPADCNYSGAMDKDGNSDREKARRLIEADRKKVAGGNDPHALTRRKAELPLCPREMMMRISGTKFPIADITEHLSQVEGHPEKYKQADFIGRLHISPEGHVIWKPDDTVQPIYTFPHKDNKNMPGGLIIWEHPYTTNDGNTPYGMYIAGIDSYDHDESQTTSLGSIWIMNTLTERLVAEFTGRPTSREFYETCRRMLMYYNAIGNPENHNKGILDYFDSMYSSHLFCEQLTIVKDINQSVKVDRKRGTAPNDLLNAYARTELAEWLLKPAIGDENGLLNLHKIRSIPLLKEMQSWNIDQNFDRVSAMGMLMLLKNERAKFNIKQESTVKELAEDDFWQKHFKKGYRKQTTF